MEKRQVSVHSKARAVLLVPTRVDEDGAWKTKQRGRQDVHPSCSTYLIQGHRRAGAYSSFPRVKDRLHPGQVTSERKDSSFLHVRRNLHITQLMHWGQLGVLCLAKRYFDMQSGPSPLDHQPSRTYSLLHHLIKHDYIKKQFMAI